MPQSTQPIDVVHLLPVLDQHLILLQQSVNPDVAHKQIIPVRPENLRHRETIIANVTPVPLYYR